MELVGNLWTNQASIWLVKFSIDLANCKPSDCMSHQVSLACVCTLCFSCIYRTSLFFILSLMCSMPLSVTSRQAFPWSFWPAKSMVLAAPGTGQPKALSSWWVWFRDISANSCTSESEGKLGRGLGINAVALISRKIHGRANSELCDGYSSSASWRIQLHSLSEGKFRVELVPSDQTYWEPWVFRGVYTIVGGMICEVSEIMFKIMSYYGEKLTVFIMSSEFEDPKFIKGHCEHEE